MCVFFVDFCGRSDAIITTFIPPDQPGITPPYFLLQVLYPSCRRRTGSRFIASGATETFFILVIHHLQYIQDDPQQVYCFESIKAVPMATSSLETGSIAVTSGEASPYKFMLYWQDFTSLPYAEISAQKISPDTLRICAK